MMLHSHSKFTKVLICPYNFKIVSLIIEIGVRLFQRWLLGKVQKDSQTVGSKTEKGKMYVIEKR